MFTQSMPAYANALRSGQMFPAMQALGNCAQPLAHRGSLNINQGAGQNRRGVYTTPQYNPADYGSLFPGTPQGDLPGMSTTWNYGNRYDSQFYFPTNQLFTQNQFFGGPNIRYEGGMQGDTYEGDTIVVQQGTVREIQTEVINGEPVEGLPGPPGRPGLNGFVAGAPPNRRNPIPVFAQLRYLQGVAPFGPRFRPIQVRFARPMECVEDMWRAPMLTVGLPTNSISGATVTVGGTSVPVPTNAISGGTVTLDTLSVTIPTGVTFDAELCAVTWTGTTTVYALASPTAAFTGTTASTTSVYVLPAATVAATVESITASTTAVLTFTTATTSKDSLAGVGVVIKGIRKTPPSGFAAVTGILEGVAERQDNVMVGLR